MRHLTLLPVLACVLGTLPAAAREPAAGDVLVAARSTGSVFERSIVYLLEHGDGGTLGLIVNRPGEVSLAEAAPGLGELDTEGHRLRFGGPVGLDALKFLLRSERDPGEAVRVTGDVFASGSPELLARLLREKVPASDLLIFVGYAGWAPRQLAGEMERGVWELERLPTEVVFSAGPELWEELIARLDPPGIRIRFPARLPFAPAPSGY